MIDKVAGVFLNLCRCLLEAFIKLILSAVGLNLKDGAGWGVNETSSFSFGDE